MTKLRIIFSKKITHRNSIVNLIDNMLTAAKITIVLIIITLQEITAGSIQGNHISNHHISARSLPLWVASLNKTDSGKNVTSRLDEILKRIGPNMRSSSDFNDFNDIYLNESVLAWKMMHDQVRGFALHQVDQYAPQIESLLKQAQVSDQCLKSIQWILESMRRLDSRAIQSK